MTSQAVVVDKIKKIVPPLSHDYHKGQAGRVGVVGGSEDYTGAAYFSAIAALKSGVDMAHVICEPGAATVIKGYSPDLMVHPYLRINENNRSAAKSERIIDTVAELFPRIHVLVVGPGLSRDALMLEYAKGIILRAKKENLPIIIDADGLFLVQNDPGIIQNYQKAVLTPNVNEFRRLCNTMGIPNDNTSLEEKTLRLSKLFGVTIIQKGKNDIISNGESVIVCDTTGSPRRCGGQGDILTGLIATFIAWGRAYENKLWNHDNSIQSSELPVLASYAGCTIVRECSRVAFEEFGRSMQTSDLIPKIGPVLDKLYSR
ncbi:462_t:CDS:10 [Paraglomus brasilianum]|uniref:ATP-dependent (S)-NAD(P)H-hydrate dehydratase n=1 Tax=Paraglomus brasilianum TaxID=144538 RepID=A0A9N9AQR0_9GLOM|nr:462_t:CDS:10 [Paraglomus brasilianum]